MYPQSRRSVINLACLLPLLCGSSVTCAAPVAATITHLSGPLMVKRADNSVKILAVRSELEVGDTLVTEKNTYAQLKFIDNSDLTLQPGTTLRIDAFDFDPARPDADNAGFTLVDGGVRSVTGALGKRNKERFALNTPTATITVRGTTFVASYVAPAAGATTPAPLQPGTSPLLLPPGLYVRVLDGLIHLTNKAGTQSFSAGQFGFTPSLNQPPVIVPANPGMKFSPPPSFTQPGVPAGTSSAGSKAGAIDCVVR